MAISVQTMSTTWSKALVGFSSNKMGMPSSGRPAQRILTSVIFVTKIKTRTRIIGRRFQRTRTRIIVIQKTKTK